VFHHVEQRVAASVSAYLKARYGSEAQGVLESPKEPRFGELSLASAFQLARQLRKAPRQIADEIVAGMPLPEDVASLEIAGAASSTCA